MTAWSAPIDSDKPLLATAARALSFAPGASLRFAALDGAPLARKLLVLRRNFRDLATLFILRYATLDNLQNHPAAGFDAGDLCRHEALSDCGSATAFPPTAFPHRFRPANDVAFPDSDWSWYGEVWIAIRLCREFITVAEGFFDRVFEALDLPPRYEARVSRPE